MENYIFRNEMKFSNRASRRKVLLRLGGALLLLVFVLKTMFDGFSIVTLWLVLIGAGMLMHRGSHVRVENVLTEMGISPEGMRLKYRDLDRHDGRGMRNETYEIDADRLRRLRYNERYHMLEIISQPVMTEESPAGVVTKDFLRDGEMDRQIIYLKDDDIREGILRKIGEVDGSWQR